MFGLTDILYSSLDGDLEVDKADDFQCHFIEQPGETTWVCFLPWRTDLATARKHELLPESGNLIVYEGPCNLISADPVRVRRAMTGLKNHYKKIYETKKLSEKKLAYCGLSVGSIPAMHLANCYKGKKIVIAFTTTKLGEGIYRAFAARKIKRAATKRGLTAEGYDKIMAEFNPVENIDNLPEEIVYFMSRFDNYVPATGGKKLLEILKKKDKRVTVKQSRLFGHVLSLRHIGKRLAE